MTASKACRDLIRSFESLRLRAYRCPAGVWTIGYGHTSGVSDGMEITEEQAERMFADDVANVERALLAVFPGVEWRQCGFDALVSLGFNLKGGPVALPRKAPKLTAAVQRGDWKAVGAELLDINKANGQVLAGLTRRREAEAGLMESA